MKVSEVGAKGALVIAATAFGELEDLGKATQGLVAIDRAFACEPEKAALAEDRFKAFEDLYRAFGPVKATLQKR